MSRAVLVSICLQPCFAAHAAAQDAALFVARPTQITRLEDLNGDGDFLDFAESQTYATALPATLGRLVARDGAFFVTAPQARQVLVITDLNADGDALDFAETALYATIPDAVPPPEPIGLAAAADASLLVADRAGGRLYRLRDLDADGDALDFAEIVEIGGGLTAPLSVAVRPDGLVLVVQDSAATPVRILEDHNADGDYFDFAENLSYAEGLSPGGDLLAVDPLTSFLPRPATGEVLMLHDWTQDDDALDFAEVVVYASGLSAPLVLTADAAGGLLVAAQDAAGTLYYVRDLTGDDDALDFAEVLPVATGLNQPTGIALVSSAAAPCLAGDVDLSGAVDLADVGPFVDILLELASPADPCTADVNSDAEINGLDIAALVALLVP